MRVDPTWIVVADDHAARFFLRTSGVEHLCEYPILVDAIARRVGPPDSVADARARVDRGKASQTFLHRVAAEIDRAVLKNEAKGLVLCAPSQELGLLRTYISLSSLERLTCELSLDFVAAKTSSIEAEMNWLKV